MKRFIKQAAKAFVAAAGAVFSTLGTMLTGDAGIGSLSQGQWFTVATVALTAFLAVYSVPNSSSPASANEQAESGAQATAPIPMSTPLAVGSTSTG
jgi:hypothetical protein